MNMKQRMPKRMPPNQCPPLISLLVSRLYFCGMFFECSLVTATMYQLICMYVLLSYMYEIQPWVHVEGHNSDFLKKYSWTVKSGGKKFLRICYFSSTTLSICGMKSGQAFPFIAFEKLVKIFSLLLTCTHEATTLPESCVCLPLSLCLVSILLECNACAHALLPLVLSPPSLPALTLTIPNLQVSACLKKGREKPQSQNVCM